jgi:general secretion pathway protein E
MTQAAVARTSADFTLSFVLTALVQAKLLTPSQAQDVRTKEQAARARVLKQVGADKDEARYTVSPIEVVAAVPGPAGRRTDAGPGQDLGGDRRCRGRGLQEDRSAQARHGAGHSDGLQALRAEARAACRWTGPRPARWWWRSANPFDRELLENLHRLAGMPIEPVLSAKADILKAIADIYGFKRTLAQAATDFAQPTGAQLQNFEQLVSLSGGKELEASDKPIVNAVDYLLRYAYDNRASDIHIEPKRDSTVVRLRIDGRAAPGLHPSHRGAPADHQPDQDALSHRHLGEATAAGRDGSRPSETAGRSSSASPRSPPPSARRWSSASSIRRRWYRTSPSWGSTRPRRASSSRGSTSRTGSSWSPGPPARARPPPSTRR